MNPDDPEFSEESEKVRALFVTLALIVFAIGLCLLSR